MLFTSPITEVPTLLYVLEQPHQNVI